MPHAWGCEEGSQCDQLAAIWPNLLDALNAHAAVHLQADVLPGRKR